LALKLQIQGKILSFDASRKRIKERFLIFELLALAKGGELDAN